MSPLNFINKRIKSFSDSIQKTPILHALVALIFSVIGFTAETLTERFILPDITSIKVESLEKKIEDRTTNIEGLLGLMQQSINDMEGDPETSEKFLESALSLQEELEALRPEIKSFANDARKLSEELFLTKIEELSIKGVSLTADIILKNNTGVTVCPEQFSLGVSAMYNQNHVNSNKGKGDVLANLGIDGIYEEKRLAAGQSVSLEAGDKKASVNYLGRTDDFKSARFDVNCG